MKSLIKMTQRAGFTLVEALIVLAILGVLAAVAIPAYSIQLENSRIKVDETTLATAGSMAVSDYLLHYNKATETNQIYQAYQQRVGTNTLLKVVPMKRPPGFDPVEELDGWGPCLPTSHKYENKTMYIFVVEGTLKECFWQ